VLRAEDGARASPSSARTGIASTSCCSTSMPGLSGERLRAPRAIDPGVRVILSSGYDTDEAKGRFGASPPAGFIQKPYRPEQLVAEIGRCLRPQPA
jgi:DNA-binding NarL/FixJ family response regulator